MAVIVNDLKVKGQIKIMIGTLTILNIKYG